MGAMDFQMTGIPVIRCRKCNGYLASRRSAAALTERFRFVREHEQEYAALGESIAGAMKRRMELGHGPVVRASDVPIPLPVVVPLSDDGPEVLSFPVVTYLLVGVSVSVYLFSRMAEVTIGLPGGLPGLPSGAGVYGLSFAGSLVSLFLHAGFVPLAAGSLFLFVLGDNIEDRMGWLPYLLLYLLCGVFAGILGAYLVFFPDVSIRMYGLGQVTTVPAYLFACTWVAAAFLIGPGPFVDIINPAPLSLSGNIAGFGTGVFGAILWRVAEDSVVGRRVTGEKQT